MIQAHFSGIKDILVNKISSSTNDIVVAMAWFTHRDLFGAILSALDKGVSVSIILIDDIINRSEYGLDFEEFIKRGGELRFANKKKALMHNKFCLFDNKTLITGSYNWTYSAERQNAENIVETDDTNVCNDFKNHFYHLWEGQSEIKKYTHKHISNIKDNEFLRNYDNFYEEFALMASKEIIDKKVLNDIRNRQKNILVTKIATIKTVTNRAEPRLKFSLGQNVLNKNELDRKKNGDIISVIIKKDTPLPFTNTIETVSSFDNQETCRCGIYYGESYYKSQNKLLLEVKLDKLPKLPKGELKFKTKVNVDTNGYIHLEYLCVNTGIAKEAVYVYTELIEYSTPSKGKTFL